MQSKNWKKQKQKANLKQNFSDRIKRFAKGDKSLPNCYENYKFSVNWLYSYKILQGIKWTNSNGLINLITLKTADPFSLGM